MGHLPKKEPETYTNLITHNAGSRILSQIDFSLLFLRRHVAVIIILRSI